MYVDETQITYETNKPKMTTVGVPDVFEALGELCEVNISRVLPVQKLTQHV